MYHHCYICVCNFNIPNDGNKLWVVIFQVPCIHNLHGKLCSGQSNGLSPTLMPTPGLNDRDDRRESEENVIYHCYKKL